MGTLETAAKKQRRMSAVQQAILATVAVSGLLAVAMVAGNTIQLLRKIPRFKKQFRYRSDKILTRLAQDKFITFEERRGKRYVRITSEGSRQLMLRGNELIRLATKPKRWDKRWRVVIFDIPEYRRSIRDSLRTTMRRFGFYRLQDSVWVYPYDCEDVVALLKTDLRAGASVLYMIVEKMENDRHLKEHFLLR